MVVLRTILSVIFAAQAIASPVKPDTPYAVKERHFVPRGWKPLKRAPGEFVIDLNIGLKQNNFAELERHLYEGMFNDFRQTEIAADSLLSFRS